MTEPRVVIVSTPREREDAVSVRIAVFVVEQGIPREEEIDEHDDTAVHCVGYVDHAPVAAGRLVIADGDSGKIGRMAVLASHRNRGLGRVVLDALELEAGRHGIALVKLSAQLRARSFYDRAGYTAVGDIYDEVGIPHIAMEKHL